MVTDMLIKTIPVGFLETNCYIVTDETTRKCVVIDPGADSNTILDYIESNNLIPEAVFLTHGHFDHVMALDALIEATEAAVYIHELDVDLGNKSGSHDLSGGEYNHRYAEGDTVRVGGLIFTVLETPGHTRGSVTIKCESALFTGDTLFRDSCGRTDLEGGDPQVMLSSLRRLSSLDEDYEVYPGHADSTTLSRERSFNLYMRNADGR